MIGRNADGSTRFRSAPNIEFAGGVSVAVGDVTRDSRDDIVTGTGPGGGPHVRGFASALFNEVRSFYAFDPDFGGGVYVG